jgi:hypothetical protein
MTTHQTQLRLRVYSSPHMPVRSLLEELAKNCRVVMKAIALNGSPTVISVGSSTQSTALEIELSGPLDAIQCWLGKLGDYPFTIQGKANPDGDGWYY